MVQWDKTPTAVAQITMKVRVQSLAWELPYAKSSAIKKNKKRSSRHGAVVSESD